MRRWRPTFRERITSSHASLRFLAGPSEKPDAVERVEREVMTTHLPPKRERVKRPVDGRAAHDIEAPVIAAVGELLAVHPHVLLAVRQNSGAMPYERDGRLVPVWFYKLIRCPEKLTIVDYWGFLKDARPFAIECKRPSWKEPETERELKQRAYLDMIASLGGVSGFVRSADEARALLP